MLSEGMNAFFLLYKGNLPFLKKKKVGLLFKELGEFSGSPWFSEFSFL